MFDGRSFHSLDVVGKKTISECVLLRSRPIILQTPSTPSTCGQRDDQDPWSPSHTMGRPATSLPKRPQTAGNTIAGGV